MRVWLLALVGIAALACGPAQAPVGAPGESGGPQRGGQLHHRITSDIDNFDITVADKAVAGRIVPLPNRWGSTTAFSPYPIQDLWLEKG